MSLSRVIGVVFSGFMVRAYGAALALYVGTQAAHYVAHVFSAINSLPF